MVCYDPFQNSEFDGAFSYEFEKDIFEDKPLKQEQCLDLFKGSQKYRISHISNHSCDENCWDPDGEPIYDTNSKYLKKMLHILWHLNVA